ncbi:MAG TPA: hypothetical protein VF028_14885 [Actinomycetota bacterium]|jgi:hypothetical protein|nr:hypothetical protein [Actinomycetota bacterium]
MSGLDGYLNDHLAGSAAALQLVERARARDPESELGYVLVGLRDEIEEDRAVLDGVLATLGGTANPAKRAGALGMELLANLRTTLPVVGAGSSDAARLEELEVLSLGIEGKRLLWKTLAELSSEDGRLAGFDFIELERRADAQRERLERFRLQLAAAAFKA